MAEDRKKDQQFRLEVDANEIAQIKEGEFEGTITAILTRGSRATANQQIQLYLAGQPFGNLVPTDENGRVIKDFSITTAAKTISVEAQTVGFATRAKKFIDLPRPEKETKRKTKPKRQVSKLEQISVATTGQTLVISLARIDEADKSISGKIFYSDPVKDAIQKIVTDKSGIATIALPIGRDKRTIIFFLPEKPKERIEIEIPAVKKEVAQIEKPEKTTPIKPLKERIAEAYKKGRRC